MAKSIQHNVAYVACGSGCASAGGDARCVGDAIVLVVAEDEATLEKAKKLVKIDYEPLEPVRNIVEAKAADAPHLHDSFFAFGNTVELKDNVCQCRHVTRGDAAKALAESAFTVTQRFTTPFTEHAFLEPECAVAFPYKNGVKVQSTDQGAYDTRKECAHMFGWDSEPERVVVETMLVGGGFGGKEDVSIQHLAALAAYKLQRPVKCKLTRAESLAFHPKRHAMDGTFTLVCNTVFLQDVAEACGLPLHCIANGECSTENAPDSGTTSGSRQTVVTGKAVRGAAFLLRDAMLDIEAGKSAPAAPVNAHGDGVKIEYDDGRAYQLHTQELVAGQGMHPQDPAAAIKALEGCEFGYVYLEPTDKLGADVPNPKSHICYGFATHVVILDDDGRVSEVYAAHDSGKVVNPISIQGQIEGGVLMGMGYALTEDWPLKDCVPQARYGTLGLFRAPEIPDIHAIYVEKDELLPVAYGGKGIGEIATIPTAPAVQNAYRAFDGKLRPDLPMVDTPYSRVRHRG